MGLMGLMGLMNDSLWEDAKALRMRDGIELSSLFKNGVLCKNV
jgi:hypothetical protein